MSVSPLSAPSSAVPANQWRAAVAPFRTPSLKRSLWQVFNTVVPFLLVWYAMYRVLSYSPWLILALAPIAAGLLIRIFIIFHDCGHASFFKSQRVNHIVGMGCGVLCFTPYFQWRHFHAVHHATSGDLDRRIEGEVLPLTIAKYAKSSGHVLTLTVKEYQELSSWEQLTYRVYRNPFVLFGIIPIFLFLVLNRFCDKGIGRREKWSVWGTNLALLAISVVMTLLIGFWPYVLIQLSILTVTATLGVWLFYVQHQFEDSYWEQHAEWNFAEAALEGSSYYQLPRVLQWFTGNIGFHHIHHLSPRIPNYYLEACHKADPLFQNAQTITLGTGWKSVNLRLWDEDQQKLISFRDFKKQQRAQQ